MTSLPETDIAEIAEGLGEDHRQFAGRTVLLCGAAGFLGQYFLGFFDWLNRHRLADAPVRVVALDNGVLKGGDALAATAGGEDIAHMGFVAHDITRPYRHRGRLDYIIHAAGIASPFHYRARPLETLEVATAGTHRLLELARRKGARVLYFSSSEIYGDPDPAHIPTPESYRGSVSPQGPRACYDESKRLGETLCYIFHQHFGVDCNIVRPFNVYGPGMRENDYRVLANIASRIRSRRAIDIYGSGRQTRTFCYTSDALTGFLRVLTRGVPGETYNIGNPRPEISMLELIERVQRVVGRAVPWRLIEYPDSYPSDEPARRCPDIRKARLQLEFQPRVTLDDGLRRFFAWADAQYTGED